MRLCFLFGLLAFICGCANTKELRKSDGSIIYTTSCRFGFMDFNTCFEEANQVCPKGWDIISQIENEKNRLITYSCKKSKNASK